MAIPDVLTWRQTLERLECRHSEAPCSEQSVGVRALSNLNIDNKSNLFEESSLDVSSADAKFLLQIERMESYKFSYDWTSYKKIVGTLASHVIQPVSTKGDISKALNEHRGAYSPCSVSLYDFTMHPK